MNDYYLFAMFAILITRKYDYFDVLKAVTANNLCFLFCSFLAQTTILIIEYFQLKFPSKKSFFRTENDQQLPYVFFTSTMIYILISYNGPSSDTLRRA